MRLPRAREPSRSSVGDHKRMENRGRMPVISARRFGRSLGGEACQSARKRDPGSACKKVVCVKFSNFDHGGWVVPVANLLCQSRP